MSAAHLRGAHVRLPDERPRLRAAVRAAGGRRLPAGRPRRRRPTSSCSTPARCGRTPTTGSTATSASWRRSRPPARACRSPSAAAWRRRTATRSCAGRRGSTSSSAPTTSARCRCCWSGPGTTRGRRWRSSSRWRCSRPRCRPGASRRTPAWVSISVGCNNTCTSASCRPCAAPSGTAGPATCSPRSRRWSPTACSRSPCSGRTSTPTASSSATAAAFATLLRACGGSTGLERVRFTSPHPQRFTDDVIEAMAETPNVMPQLHMPLQSGSDAVLRRHAPLLPPGALPRHPRAGPGGDPGCGDLDRHHRRASPARPRRTSRDTLDVVAPARFARPSPSSTPRGRGRRPRRCRPGAQGRRAGALRAAGRAAGGAAWQENLAPGGRRLEVLVAEGEGRKDGATHGAPAGPGQPAGALRPAPLGGAEVRPGDVVTVEVTYGAPHHLIADGARRRAPDPRRRRLAGPRRPQPRAPAVSLGMPSIGPPALSPVATDRP